MEIQVLILIKKKFRKIQRFIQNEKISVWKVFSGFDSLAIPWPWSLRLIEKMILKMWKTKSESENKSQTEKKIKPLNQYQNMYETEKEKFIQKCDQSESNFI